MIIKILKQNLSANVVQRLMDYVTLTRLDRPIGIFLLLWPTLTGLWIAAEGWPGWHLLLVFILGTILTRSAGCILNDLADRHFDGHVKRTVDRPLVTGKVDPLDAMLLAGGILFIALLLVLTTNLFTVVLAAVAAVITAIYPFMKRHTYVPQAILGLAFSMGILMAFTAVNNEIDNVAWLLLIANLLWVVAYDTEYAMVDRDDDLKLGLKSTAILFAELDKLMIGILQAAALLTLYLAARTTGLGLAWYLGLAVGTGFFAYQQYLIRHRQREACFRAFLNNHWAGLSIFIGAIVHYLLN